MQTLTDPSRETISNRGSYGYPHLLVGAEKEPARSFSSGVEFELRFRPYAQRIFRAALILTRSPERANRLANEIWQKAWRNYAPMPATEFTSWLSRLLQQFFAEYRTRA